MNDTTDPGAMRVELHHVRERHDEWNERQDTRLNSHARRLGDLEDWRSESRGERRMLILAVSGAAGLMSLLGSMMSLWLQKGP